MSGCDFRRRAFGSVTSSNFSQNLPKTAVYFTGEPISLEKMREVSGVVNFRTAKMGGMVTRFSSDSISCTSFRLPDLDLVFCGDFLNFRTIGTTIFRDFT